MTPRAPCFARALVAALAVAASIASCGSSQAGTTALLSTTNPGTRAAFRSPRTARSTPTDPALSLITEPNQGIAPLLDQVTEAKRSVDVVMYELSDPRFEAALAADAHRGVRVRVLLNEGYYGAGGFSQNDAAVAYLKAHGVSVHASPAYFALTHQKTIVIDGDTADIMTLNLTAQDYASSRDFAVIDRQPADVAAIEATFDADWSGRQITPSTGTGDLVWSPGALDSQLNLIDSARQSIDVYNEEMDDSQVTDALAAAARRGVDVKVVMTADSEWDSAFDQLTAAGVHVRTYPDDASLYIHAKLILVDGHEAFVGSQNFSAGSLNHNRELGIVLTQPAILASLRSTFASDYAGANDFSRPATPQSTTPTTPTTSHNSGCMVSASFDSSYDDWNVEVSGAPADTEATATADGVTHSYRTDAAGDVDIYLDAPESDAGATVTVTAGSASCTGTL